MSSVKITEPASVATLDTFSHVRIDLRNPIESKIELEDIANGLSLICRFNGQIPRFYSVAQHSVLVSALCPDDLKLEGLLHDAPEAYIGDVIKPLKDLLGVTYKGIEMNFERVIFNRFKLSLDRLHEVKKYDLMAYDLEDQALRKNQPSEFEETLGRSGLIVAGSEVYWRPIIAKMQFMHCYIELMKKRRA